MPKYQAYGRVIASKYIGEFEAANEEEARKMAVESDKCYVSLCHQCAGEAEDPEIDEIDIVEVEGE